VIADYYRDRFGATSEIITYGAFVDKSVSPQLLDSFGLRKGEYILYVSRLEPENNALGLVQAYSNLKTEIPLVVVGDAPYAKQYIEKVKAAADSRVIFTGYQFGDVYHALQANCLFYIQASEVGGTHPALVSAMAYGNCVVANDVPEHREVLGDAGSYYRYNDFEDLTAVMADLLSNRQRIRSIGAMAATRAHKLYSWESVTSQYLKLFYEALSSKATLSGAMPG
jgi:glycosyltransferase involved in cell wall biosynthesis